MDPSWFLLVLSAAVLVSLVLLAVLCLDCWNKGPVVSIRQTDVSEEYIQSTEFRVIHPLHPAGELNSIRSVLHPLSPQSVLSSSSNAAAQQRYRCITPTETDSNPSYENPGTGRPYENPNVPDSDVEDSGYIIVIPDTDGLAPSNLSRASTPSSDVRNDYVNFEEEKQDEEPEDEREYLNVDPNNPNNLMTHLLSPAHSYSRLSNREEPAENDATSESTAQSETDDDDDDEEGNYVNQPPLIHSQLRA